VRNWRYEAQQAAEWHLDACMAAEEASEVGRVVDTPACAPFCGCDTCSVREALYAAWPYAMGEAVDELVNAGLLAAEAVQGAYRVLRVPVEAEPAGRRAPAGCVSDAATTIEANGK
jgi:hypothetical protein